MFAYVLVCLSLGTINWSVIVAFQAPRFLKVPFTHKKLKYQKIKHFLALKLSNVVFMLS